MIVLRIAEASQEKDKRLKVCGAWVPSFSQTKYHLQPPGAVTSLFSTNKFMVSAKWQVQGRQVWSGRPGLLPQSCSGYDCFALWPQRGIFVLSKPHGRCTWTHWNARRWPAACSKAVLPQSRYTCILPRSPYVSQTLLLTTDIHQPKFSFHNRHLGKMKPMPLTAHEQEPTHAGGWLWTRVHRQWPQVRLSGRTPAEASQLLKHLIQLQFKPH